jgi:hypothetical protein
MSAAIASSDGSGSEDDGASVGAAVDGSAEAPPEQAPTTSAMTARNANERGSECFVINVSLPNQVTLSDINGST